MPDTHTLYVCHLRDGSIPPHACRRAAEAMREKGHAFEMVVAGQGRPLGLFTTGKRPEMKALSGQEKLPVLKLADGTVIAGSAKIISWAGAHTPVQSGGA